MTKRGEDLSQKRVVWASSIVMFAVFMVLLTSCGKEDSGDKSRGLEQRLQKLRSVPYTAVSEEKVSGDTVGVTVYDAERAWPGYNLYCSRIDPEAFLIDMQGNVVHRWSYEQDAFNYWNYAILLENGDIIVLNKFLYILQIDWDSNLRWEERRPVHHDVAKAEDGTIYVIERRIEKYRDLDVRFAEIAQLGPEGGEIDRWSTYDELDDLRQALDETSFLDTVLDSLLAEGIPADSIHRIAGKIHIERVSPQVRLYDYFHLNTITILPDRPPGRSDPRFAAGNLLICLRNVNQIAVLDWGSKKILWGWGEGVLEWPHHPTMLENGNILIFDNGVVRKYSKVIELDPLTETVVWEYVADPPGRFYTHGKGSAQRLPNGNTLICEGDRGRVFEVDPGGEIVWEWYSPINKNGQRILVYRMIRYPPRMVEPLLER